MTDAPSSQNAPPAGFRPTPTSSAPPVMPRPGHVTAAGIIHIVAGSLTILFGLLFLLAGLLLGPAITDMAPELGGMGGVVTGVLMVIAVIALAVGGLVLLTGIKVLGGRPWARITGIVIAILGALFSLLGLGAEDTTPVLNIIFLGAWAYAAWALFAHGAWFESRRNLA